MRQRRVQPRERESAHQAVVGASGVGVQRVVQATQSVCRSARRRYERGALLAPASGEAPVLAAARCRVIAYSASLRRRAAFATA